MNKNIKMIYILQPATSICRIRRFNRAMYKSPSKINNLMRSSNARKLLKFKPHFRNKKHKLNWRNSKIIRKFKNKGI